MGSTLPFGSDVGSLLNRLIFQEGVSSANTGKRIPILWESPLSRREGRSLRMAINPKTIQFQQPKRISTRDAMAGKIYYHWTDERGRDNDILTLTINGTTGNIDPRVLGGSGAKKDALGNLAKHLAWAKLYQLTTDPIIDPLTNSLNLATCTIQTVLIPFPIQFEGHFSSVMGFSDDADNPFSKSWSLSFVARDINPPLNTIVSLLQVALVTGLDLAKLQKPLSFTG